MARHDGKVLAVLGASGFQVPLIQKAQELGCTVHAFAWACGDVGEDMADVFHPVSTADCEEVLHLCREARIDGICTIGSDFNNVTATWVANQLGLSANSDECAHVSTNKSAMRRAFAAAGDPSPRSVALKRDDDFASIASGFKFPVIVKPSDRSGSRGINKVLDASGLPLALEAAWEESFEGLALVEEYLEGDEFSVESISWEGTHRVLQITRKYTTGAPHFIESGHIQPPLLDDATMLRVEEVVTRALDTLRVRQGASHAEVKINDKGEPWIVEIGSRMGGDFIGSHLVQLSTGFDFVGAVVDVALGIEPEMAFRKEQRAAAVRFVFDEGDSDELDRLRRERPELIVEGDWHRPHGVEVTDSSNRHGYCILSADSVDELLPWMP